jgi:hypothetical protein
LEPNGARWESQEASAHPQQKLRKKCRDAATRYAKQRVHPKLRWVHQLILWNLEQGMVAKKNPQHHPGGGRSQHYRAHHRRMEIAHNLLQRE